MDGLRRNGVCVIPERARSQGDGEARLAGVPGVLGAGGRGPSSEKKRLGVWRPGGLSNRRTVGALFRRWGLGPQLERQVRLFAHRIIVNPVTT